ncbi:hypothetical protein QUB47_16565 [Microcoleus sp. AT9_B5]
MKKPTTHRTNTPARWRVGCSPPPPDLAPQLSAVLGYSSPVPDRTGFSC